MTEQDPVYFCRDLPEEVASKSKKSKVTAVCRFQLESRGSDEVGQSGGVNVQVIYHIIQTSTEFVNRQSGETGLGNTQPIRCQINEFGARSYQYTHRIHANRVEPIVIKYLTVALLYLSVFIGRYKHGITRGLLQLLSHYQQLR